MTQRDDDPDVIERVRSQIRSAFPDVIHSGPITPADGKTGEDYADHGVLYGVLHGRAWSEVPVSFIRENDDGLALLTEEAFVAYLPAWLIEGLVASQVGDALIYTFCPDPGNDHRFMDRRIQLMSSVQKEALSAFLSHYAQASASKYIKDRAKQAVVYVNSFL
jgi:hypothetical protein